MYFFFISWIDQVVLLVLLTRFTFFANWSLFWRTTLTSSAICVWKISTAASLAFANLSVSSSRDLHMDQTVLQYKFHNIDAVWMSLDVIVTVINTIAGWFRRDSIHEWVAFSCWGNWPISSASPEGYPSKPERKYYRDRKGELVSVNQ